LSLRSTKLAHVLIDFKMTVTRSFCLLIWSMFGTHCGGSTSFSMRQVA
jgi:hypothetical protein